MNEIRFNQVKEPNQSEGALNKEKQNTKSRFFKKIVKPFLLVILLIALVTVGFFAKNFIPNNISSGLNTSLYSAVFLTNGQVYFGKIVSKNDSEFVLSDVYYLQISGDAAAQAQLAEPKFSLIKLGNELHGPTDKMFINSSQVLFYENLRDNSKVVQSIKDYK